MKTLELDFRYYHLQRVAGVTESDFQHRTLRLSLPVDGIALVMVDVWSDHYIASHKERSRDITLSRIKPVLEAFRNIGATVIHAPSPDCARMYPQWTQFAGDEEVRGRSAQAKDSWPPGDFRKKEGDFAGWARPKEPKDQVFDEIIANRRIVPEVEPQEGDHVIVTGSQLHRLLAHRKILHLFYVGFAANMCVPFRDYGMRAMKERGYDITLIRDCTSAIEVDDTVAAFGLTEAAARDVELNIGYTVTSADLVAACERA